MSDTSLTNSDLSLPSGWEAKVLPTTGQARPAQLWISSPPNDNDVWLGCFSSVRSSFAALAELCGDKLFQAEPHELDEVETRITEWWRTGFALESGERFARAETGFLGSFKAIHIERTWHDGKRTYEALVEPQQDGQLSILFFYAAPPVKFDQYWETAKNWLENQAPHLVPTAGVK